MNEFYPNYIICPKCNKKLSLDFVNKFCDNCGFLFSGIKSFLYKDDGWNNTYDLAKELNEKIDSNIDLNDHDLLLKAAFNFNSYSYLRHFIICDQHRSAVFEKLLKRHLIDVEILKVMLQSEYIDEHDRNAVVIYSKDHNYKISKVIYKYLMDVQSKEIKEFITENFNGLRFNEDYIPFGNKYRVLETLVNQFKLDINQERYLFEIINDLITNKETVSTFEKDDYFHPTMMPLLCCMYTIKELDKATNGRAREILDELRKYI